MKTTLITIMVIIGILTTGFLVKNSDTSTQTKQPAVTESKSGNTISADKVLNLSGQGITKVPMSVFDRTEITELNLSNNLLSGALQSQVNQLKNLKVLNLSNNKFTGVPAEVGQLKDLEVLDLSNNLLTGLPNEIGNLSKLKLLDVSGNNYSEVDLSIIKKNLPTTTVIKTN